MKKICCLILITLLVSATVLAGCSKSSISENKAKSFVKSLYTVNAKEAALTSFITNSNNSNKFKNIITLQEKFKPMMTDDAYSNFNQNTTYYQIAKYVAKNNTELKARDVKLEVQSETKDLTEFSYTVKAKAGDKDITEEGKVQVKNKDNKVSYIERIKTDDFLKS